MKKLILVLLIVGVVTYVYAKNIATPPRFNDLSVPVQQYLEDVAGNFNNVEVVTTNPDGSRNGRYGDMVLLVTGGNYYVEICTSSPDGTVWRGVQLTDSP